MAQLSAAAQALGSALADAVGGAVGAGGSSSSSSSSGDAVQRRERLQAITLVAVAVACVLCCVGVFMCVCCGRRRVTPRRPAAATKRVAARPRHRMRALPLTPEEGEDEDYD